MKTAAALLIFAAAHGIAAEINIGSKRFTESYVLGEIANQYVGYSAVRERPVRYAKALQPARSPGFS